MENIKILNNLPHSNEVWRGIGGHFDSLGQIICEFVDNSVSNFLGNVPTARNIVVKFEEKGSNVKVSIEDTGTGILDLDNAFKLGGNDKKDSPLNEHGFGMKHALASANATNDNWLVCTRTLEDYNDRKYKRIKAAYLIQSLPVEIVEDAENRWPGQFQGPGTYVEFTTSYSMFNTLRAGVPGQPSFTTVVGYLIEDLGFVYSGIIQRNEASLTVVSVSSNTTINTPVPAIKPDWEQFLNPPGTGKDEFDLGNGKVDLNYSFGAMKESTHKRYYKRNMSSSGLEVRINGRLLEYNLFKEVWHIERHNMYNHILVLVDIVSKHPDRLPGTRTSKNGLRQGDPLLESLYEWVRRLMPTPPKKIQEDPQERDLFDELANRKRVHVPDPKVVNTEQYVYNTIGERVRVDLYMTYGNSVILYEGKKDSTTVKDVYQLKMYWDGAALDGLRPTEGILLATHHPESVVIMINHLNQMTDISGKPYRFKAKTWREEGIEYP